MERVARRIFLGKKRDNMIQFELFKTFLKRRRYFLCGFFVGSWLFLLGYFSGQFVLSSNHKLYEVWKDVISEETLSPIQQCEIKDVQYKIEGNSMYPLLENGTTVTVKEDFYACSSKKPSRGDIIIYKSASTEWWSIVKQIRALPGDSIQFKKNRLLVNGSTLKNSVDQEYLFTELEWKMMGLYFKNWKLQDWAYLILGDNIYNSTDSRKIGAVWVTEMIGKVDFKK